MEEGSNRRCMTAMFCGRTGLLLLMTGYALLGALLFKALEGGDDLDIPAHVQRSREDCLRELWLITERLNVLYEKNWTRLVTEQLKRFERAVVESGRVNGTPNPASPHWTFGGALLYSITLLTTVGYARLSPRTALGKIVAVVYAIIGVPLMLILLSALGSMLASGAKRAYSKLCRQNNHHYKNATTTTVLYHKPPSSPHKYYCRSHEDSASIQISSSHSTPNHTATPCSKTNHHQYYENQEVPKRAILATVRASHVRGRCRQNQVKQLLADGACATHSAHSSPLKSAGVKMNMSIASSEDAEDNDENDHGMYLHDTPSRVPLIYRSSENAIEDSPPPPPSPTHSTTSLTSPSVPATLVLLFFLFYICIGAALFSSTSGWSYLDAAYFCFIALSTIGVGDRLPQSSDMDAQMQLFACCLYLFLGLVVVAMCFTLVHDEIANKCKHIANNMGIKH